MDLAREYNSTNFSGNDVADYIITNYKPLPGELYISAACGDTYSYILMKVSISPSTL